jgi:hypothetical protein
MLPTSAENVTYVYQKCYLVPLKMLPTSVKNVTYVFPKCYLHLLKVLPTSGENVSYKVYLRLVKNLPTGGRESVTGYPGIPVRKLDKDLGSRTLDKSFPTVG